MDLTIRTMRTQLGDTQREFAERYHIPFRTIQNWETGVRKPPEYIIDLLQHRVKEDLINKKTSILPTYDSHKKELPSRKNYIGSIAWLKAVRDSLGDNIVYALDEALMCQGNFGGRSDEFIIWVYGDDAASSFNGVVVIGNYISSHNIIEKNGLKYTDFNRTLSDAFANESILDMQGTLEALSRYYFKNGESFEGISVAPEYQEKLEKLMSEAVDYYNE